MEINGLAPKDMPFDYFFNLFIFNGSIFSLLPKFSRDSMNEKQTK